MSAGQKVGNFGGNLHFEAVEYLVPQNETEVLQSLEKYRGRKIRMIGRLHSWSEAPVGNDVLIDLRQLNQVTTESREGEIWATVGAGCQIKRVLAELERQAGVTLPSLGLITEQSLAGAISTGTHGSGKHSLSHYMAEVRIATYDENGRPFVRTITEGAALQAARCSLGCLGVILSVAFRTRPQYFVEEHARRHATIEDVLAAEQEFPLQQFFLIPWSWQLLGQHRRESSAPRSRLATLYRLYWFLGIDLGLHLIIQFLVKLLRSSWGVRFFYQRILGLLIIRGWKVVDHSQKMLIMEHELFRHIEIELFVRRSHLPDSLDYARQIIQVFAGDRQALSKTTRDKLSQIGLLESLWIVSGCYTHHYAICVRRVLPDDTHISMASGFALAEIEDYYALSFISYAHPSKREGFMQFANFMANSMAELFSARPHWGKFCPITSEQVAKLYPGWLEFRKFCESIDPAGSFRNLWVERVLFPESDLTQKSFSNTPE